MLLFFYFPHAGQEHLKKKNEKSFICKQYFSEVTNFFVEVSYFSKIKIS